MKMVINDRIEKSAEYAHAKIKLQEKLKEASEINSAIATSLGTMKDTNSIAKELSRFYQHGATISGENKIFNRLLNASDSKVSQGEKLGAKKAKIDFEINKLKENISALDKSLNTEYNNKLGEYDKKLYAKMFDIQSKVDESFKKLDASLDKKTAYLTERISKGEESLARFSKIVEEYQNNVGNFENAARTRARDELHQKMGSLFSEYSQMVATEAGSLERAMLNQGTKRGTIPGELLRALSMFKTFTLAFTRKHIGGELYGYHDQHVPIHKAVQRLFEGGLSGKGLGGLAGMVAIAPVFGYLSLSLKDLSKGITPRYPTDFDNAWKTWLSSAGQSGGLGYFGNFLFSDKTQYGQTLGQSLLGPGLSNMTSIADLANEAFYGVKTGDAEGIKDTGAKITRFMMHNIPGANLFWTRLPFNLMIGHRLEEMANQGSLLRKEKKLKRDTGQEYLISPNDWVNNK